MRLIVARCSAIYSGRLDTVLPEALRLIMIKADGSVLLHADAGGYKPLNWMTPPTVIEEEGGPLERIVVRKHAGKTEDRLEIALTEVLSDVTHDMGLPDEEAGLAKDGVEAHLQELLAEQPHWCGEGLRLVRREWPTDIGPVDLMCRDADDEWVAVEIKRVATIESVEQITRYLERLRTDTQFVELPRDPRGADDQAAGAGARGVARDRLRRGRPRGSAWRARARAATVRSMSDQAAVLTERRERVLVVTLNRPDQRNAVNADVATGVADALDAARRRRVAVGRDRHRRRRILLRRHGPQGICRRRDAVGRWPRLCRDRRARRPTSR